ncbi:hypothetical protein BDM02DRAFT_3112867 [Thelephora ganbajun]|uniref:Uncharacterized protein n=1 Tax=Thelephora ganbajun TaxID=370292 RepID=A0ACB6ZJP2_THEGA|nr:hypothetical protein BDM02DRAFT_3112867 [Thelephora ganbajun]
MPYVDPTCTSDSARLLRRNGIVQRTCLRRSLRNVLGSGTGGGTDVLVFVLLRFRYQLEIHFLSPHVLILFFVSLG